MHGYPIEDLRALEYEERQAAIDTAAQDFISDTGTLADAISVALELSGDVANDRNAEQEMAARYAELASILYQCEGIFADLFNGKTLEDIGTRRDLKPFRILESIRKESHELVEACVKEMLADKFGGDDE